MSTDKDSLRTQAESEARFFDSFYAAADEKDEKDNYQVPPAAVNRVAFHANRGIDDHEYAYSLLGKLDGKNILDYAAGNGWLTVCFAKAGARVWAIDISQKGVDLVRKRASANGVAASVTAEVRDCYDTGHADEMFDLIFGSGILHHLQDVDAAGKELSRLLRGNGVAVFYEPVRESKVMDRIKALVLLAMPSISAADTTENESPLNAARINQLKKYFRVVNLRYFQVFSSASKLISSDSLRRFLLRLDRYSIDYVPLFYKLARIVVVELREPIK